MAAFSEIIDFLIRLLTDDDARAEFERDPEATLESAGLEGVTAQDIRDATLQLADSGAVSATDGGSPGASSYRGDDPVREIGYTTQHYVADENVDVDGHADLNLVDRGSTVVTIDDRDTIFFQSISDDDVTITDSFNQDNSDDDLTAIQDNSVNVVAIDDSFNNEDSFNEDNDLNAVQDNSVDIGTIDLDGDGAPPDPAAPQAVDTGGGTGAPVDPPTGADAAAEPPVDVPEVDGPDADEVAEPSADTDTEPEPVVDADDTEDADADEADTDDVDDAALVG